VDTDAARVLTGAGGVRVTEKLKIRVEFEVYGPMKVVRPHREFYGKNAVAKPRLVQIEWEENEELYGACDVPDDEGAPGRSQRVEGVEGLVITPDPGLFGTDADRTAAGKTTFKQLKFGEWNILNLEKL